MVKRKQRRASASVTGKKAATAPAPAPAGHSTEGQPATHLALPMPMLEALVAYLKDGRFNFDASANLLAAMADKNVCLPLVLAPIGAASAETPAVQPSA